MVHVSVPLTSAQLRARRHALGLSQQAFGHALGVSPNTVARWERGVQRLANPMLVQLAIERLEAGRDRPSRNVPVSTSTLIGRRTELRTLQRLVTTQRMVTLFGAAGIGKTRLAVEIARRHQARGPGGVWLVELAGLAGSAALDQYVAARLGIRQLPGRTVVETLLDALVDQDVLLVLDNCEHLVEACAELIDTLLGGCPRLRILATSRQALGVAGELRWPVPPLSLPGEAYGGLDQLLRFEAIALFVARARDADPSFALTPTNAAAVAEVCRQLDGLPLAIELAAARMSVLAPQQLASRLNDRFRLLAVEHRPVPAHHQALLAALDWSFNLLSEPERRLFERLAIFAGGFSLEAAESVCSADGIAPRDVVVLLGRLVEKSLVVADPAPDTERRYRLLETLRQYAAERLTAVEAQLRLAQRHCDWCLALMERFEAEFRGPDQSAWFDRLEQERHNLFAALRWCVDHDAGERGLRLAGASWRFWEVRGYLSEGREWLGRLLEQSASLRTPARAKALDAAGHLAILQNDQLAGLPLVEAGLALALELNDGVALANGYHSLGLAAQYRYDYAAAASLHQQSLELAQAAGDRARTYVALYNLAVVAQKQNQRERATMLHEASLLLKRAAGDRWSIGYSLLNLGILAWIDGDVDRAAPLVQEALRLRWELGDKPGTAACLETLGEISASEGRARRAARLFGGAAGLLQTIGVQLLVTRHDDGRGGLNLARTQLGEAAFTAAFNAGRGVALERMVTEALASESSRRLGSNGEPPSLPTLTTREREVAQLVARGLTNRQIGLELTIAEGTATRHVANILTKLAFSTRAQVAAWTVAEHLASS